MDKNLLAAFQAAADVKARSRAELKTFDIPGVGETTFRKLNQAELRDYIGLMTEAAQKESGGTADLLLVYREMIYDCCPTLQDPELCKALGLVDPLDVVDALFDPMELMTLSSQLVDWLGLGGKGQDVLKN